jgi:uncharacterized LabA/DUF88 family protein
MHAIFIDGGYLFNMLRHEFQGVRVDFMKLVKELIASSSFPLLRTYLYDCLPHLKANPTEAEQRIYDNRAYFMEQIAGLPQFEVRYGEIGRAGDIFRQKRVDTALVGDLVRLSAKRNIQMATLIAGDSDFIPGIEIAKSEGVITQLYYGISNGHRDLICAADISRSFTNTLVEKIRKINGTNMPSGLSALAV